MKSEYGFFISTLSISISIEELIVRDEGVGPFVWVRPQNISGIDASVILAKNLKLRQEVERRFDDEDVLPEASICSYLESCVRHKSAQSNINVDDVMDACVDIMVRWGSSLPAHGFYGNIDLLSFENASRVLKVIKDVYESLSNEVLRQNIRYFVGEHYQVSGVWALGGKSRFADVLDTSDLGFVSRLKSDEANSSLNFSGG
ncbi:hypothetical protein [Variovorax sp. YR750]|uniref:hypothetical protein n=1 Tax=Variovorax sp. YR750 TaxID=1884384 RepID=UPI0011605D10|nr:hypothetical protein [Variovorax sp. YR750]